MGRNLLDLPVELLSHIFSYVADSGGEDAILDVLDLCLVSHQCRLQAQPLLFRSFHEHFELPVEESKAVPFTRALYTRPKLGESVHFVSAVPGYEPGSRQTRRRQLLNDPELFRSAIRALQLGDQQQRTWLKGLEDFDISVWVALLVDKTPNLRDLSVPAGLFSPKPLAQLLRLHPACLSRLESLWVQGGQEPAGCSYSIGSYQPLIALPELRFIHLEYGDLLGESAPASWTPGSLGVERIDLSLCHLDVAGMTKLLTACRTVTSFAYLNLPIDVNKRRTRPPTTGSREFTAAELTDALYSHRNSLQMLRLGFAREPWEVLPNKIQEHLARRVKIGSLRQFAALLDLHLEHALLPAHPEFPRSLQSLYITDCNSSIREQVQHIAADCKRGLYPTLTEIKVLTHDITRPVTAPGQRLAPRDDPEASVLALRELFNGTPVCFQILRYYTPKPTLYEYDGHFYDDGEEDGEEDIYADEIERAMYNDEAWWTRPADPADDRFLDSINLGTWQNRQDPDLARDDENNDGDYDDYPDEADPVFVNDPAHEAAADRALICEHFGLDPDDPYGF